MEWYLSDADEDAAAVELLAEVVAAEDVEDVDEEEEVDVGAED